MSLLLLLFSAKLCLFCNPIDCSPPSSSVRGIFQARILGCHSLLQGNLPDPGVKPGSSASRQILYCLSHQGSTSFSFSLNPANKRGCQGWLRGKRETGWAGGHRRRRFAVDLVPGILSRSPSAPTSTGQVKGLSRRKLGALRVWGQEPCPGRLCPAPPLPHPPDDEKQR